MSTSAIRRKPDVSPVLHETLLYLIGSIVVALFGAIYEHFSFGVYAVEMAYAFLIPLLLGVLPGVLMLRSGRESLDETITVLLRCSILTWTLGSVLTGALTIYGTTNPWLYVHAVVGGLLFLAAIGKQLSLRCSRNDHRKEESV